MSNKPLRVDKNGRYPPHVNDNVSIIDGKYVFEDKRRKSINASDYDSMEDKKLALALALARKVKKENTTREYWKRLGEGARREHSNKVSIGMKQAKMIRKIKEIVKESPCIGCHKITNRLSRDCLPRAIWICKKCENLYKKYG